MRREVKARLVPAGSIWEYSFDLPGSAPTGTLNFQKVITRVRTKIPDDLVLVKSWNVSNTKFAIYGTDKRRWCTYRVPLYCMKFFRVLKGGWVTSDYKGPLEKELRAKNAAIQEAVETAIRECTSEEEHPTTSK